MRRPLNWFVVSFSLLVLWANRVWTDPVTSTPLVREPVPASPFAYVSEDGTQVYLPDDGEMPRPPLAFEAVHSDSGFASPEHGPKAAVYTWSTPIAAATSDSPSSQ
jgi:hypothetical protein